MRLTGTQVATLQRDVLKPGVRMSETARRGNAGNRSRKGAYINSPSGTIAGAGHEGAALIRQAGEAEALQCLRRNVAAL
jgi:hypothetical protein